MIFSRHQLKTKLEEEKSKSWKVATVVSVQVVFVVVVGCGWLTSSMEEDNVRLRVYYLSEPKVTQSQEVKYNFSDTDERDPKITKLPVEAQGYACVSLAADPRRAGIKDATARTMSC